MKADGIFLRVDGRLRALFPKPYESEDLLQQLLVDFPELLAGKVTDADDERPLLLVKRERGIPDSEGAANRFSIDHFFVDAAGVPVLVEVKRQSDTRIRREVVGQMLDYAANAVRYWPIAEIRADFEQLRTQADADVDNALTEFDGGVDGFWAAVDRNLRDGRIRMLFVADGFPDELVRVIEFLNEQMTPAEVLGIEVRQYTDGDHHVFVPRVVGATTAAERTKRTSSSSRRWNRSSLVEAVTGTSDQTLDELERLLDFAEGSSEKLSWGSGVRPLVSVWQLVAGNPRPTWYLTVSAAGEPKVGVWRRDLVDNPGIEVVEPFFAQLRELPRFEEAFETRKGFPEVSLDLFGSAGVDHFMAIIRTVP